MTNRLINAGVLITLYLVFLAWYDGWSSSTAPHRDRINLDMGLAHGDEHTPAHGTAKPGSQFEIIGAHRDSRHHLLGITDQRGPFHRFGELAVLNQITLFNGEIELTRRTDASTTHGLAIQALVDGFNQLLGSMRARIDEGLSLIHI